MLWDHFILGKWRLTLSLVDCPSKGTKWELRLVNSTADGRKVNNRAEWKTSLSFSDIVFIDLASLLGSKLELIYSSPATKWSLISLNIQSAYLLSWNWAEVSFVSHFTLNKVKSIYFLCFGNLLTRSPVEILGTLKPLHIFVISKTKWSILNEVLIAHSANRSSWNRSKYFLFRSSISKCRYV